MFKIRWWKWRGASEILYDRRIPLKIKEKFYRTAVQPAIFYGSKCLATREQVEDECFFFFSFSWSAKERKFIEIQKTRSFSWERNRPQITKQSFKRVTRKDTIFFSPTSKQKQKRIPDRKQIPNDIVEDPIVMLKQKMNVIEMQMQRWMIGKTIKDWIRNK